MLSAAVEVNQSEDPPHVVQPHDDFPVAELYRLAAAQNTRATATTARKIRYTSRGGLGEDPPERESTALAGGTGKRTCADRRTLWRGQVQAQSTVTLSHRDLTERRNA